jgi:hypothetical protein
MSDLQTISITVGILTACITVIIGVLSFMKSNRRAEEQRQIEIETRQAELFMQLYSKWTSPEFRVGLLKMYQHWSWSDFPEFQARYGAKENAEDFVAGVVVPASFYEGIGVLVERGVIDVTLVNRLLSRNILLFWERLGQSFKDIEKNNNEMNNRFLIP